MPALIIIILMISPKNSLNTSYKDTDITFYMQVFHDFDRAAWAVMHLKKHFPNSRLIIMSDGDVDSRYFRLSPEAYIGNRLYPLEFGGKLIHRMLALYFHFPTKYLFKIDTDTGFHRRFRYLPSQDGYFGALQTRGTITAVQGGCAGFSHGAAEKLFSSGILLSNELIGHLSAWATESHCSRIAKKTGMIRTDWLTAYCIQQLGIKIFNFGEVRSSWIGPIINLGLRYAVTHPCKELASVQNGGVTCAGGS
jgi:hypothetical protein